MEVVAKPLADRIKELEAELNLVKTSNIVEVAIRNPSVMEYMKHWEGRAEAAEAKLKKAVEALDEAIYMLAPDERDMEKKAGIYRIVTAYEELKGETDE